MSNFFKPLLALSISFVFFACNSGTGKKDDASAMADSTSASSTTAPPAPAAFTPFDVVEITHAVKDYGKWRPFFDADSVNRKANGLDRYRGGPEA